MQMQFKYTELRGHFFTCLVVLVHWSATLSADHNGGASSVTHPSSYKPNPYYKSLLYVTVLLQAS